MTLISVSMYTDFFNENKKKKNTDRDKTTSHVYSYNTRPTHGERGRYGVLRAIVARSIRLVVGSPASGVQV